ncbi:hypothetical protein SUDANB176_05174 [Streptomyces sp. enrichment culture]
MATPTQHPRRDLEGQGQMTAKTGQFAQCPGFTRRAVVPFVGVVQGTGHEGDGVVRVERFQVDQAYRKGVGTVPGGDEHPVVVCARQERQVLGRLRRVVQDQQHAVPSFGEKRAVRVVLALRRRRQIPVPYAERVEQGQDRLVGCNRVVVVPAQVHEERPAREPAPRPGPVRRLHRQCGLADAAHTRDGEDEDR